MPPIAHGHGRSLTIRPQRAKALCSCAWSGSAPGAPARVRSDRAADPVAGDARNAGTSVSADSIVTATTIAEARPSAPTNGTPDT